MKSMMKIALLIPALCMVCAACSSNNGAGMNGSSSQESSADWAITTKVKAAIIADASISVSARLVSVSTTDGVVTIAGSVPSKEDRDRIVRIAKNVDGVVKVDNQMTIASNS